MLRHGLLAGLVLAASSLALAAADNTAVKPAHKMNNKNWADRHEKFLAVAKKGGVDVLFIGDSITQGWEGNGKEAWKSHFEPLKAANFGIGGDRTEHVLWRITEGKELDGIDPRVVVMMIGTNNVGSNTAEEIAEGVKAIVTELQKQKPNARILLLGVFPRAAKGGVKEEKIASTELQPKIKEINEIIKKLDDGKKVTYLDIGEKFLEKDGSMTKAVMYDYLHLSNKGYEIWAEAIAPKVKDLLQ